MNYLLDLLHVFAQIWWQWNTAVVSQGLIAAILLLVLLYWVKKLPVGWRLIVWWIVLLKFIVPIPYTVSIPLLPGSIIELAETATPAIGSMALNNLDAQKELDSSETVMTSVVSEMKPVVMSRKEGNLWNQIGGIEGLFLVWILGLTVLLARSAVHILSVYRLKRDGVYDPELKNVVDDLRDQLNVRKDVPVLISSQNHSPMVIGLFRPVILLPDTHSLYSTEDLRLLLCHELVHIKHRDHQLNWLLVACVMLMWWNPLVWYLRAKVHEETEFWCDDVVLQSYPGQVKTYGRLLISVVESFANENKYVVGLTFVEKRSALMRRIGRMAMKELTYRRFITIFIVIVFYVLLIPNWIIGNSSNSSAHDKEIGRIRELLQFGEEAISSALKSTRIKSTVKLVNNFENSEQLRRFRGVPILELTINSITDVENLKSIKIVLEESRKHAHSTILDDIKNPQRHFTNQLYGTLYLNTRVTAALWKQMVDLSLQPKNEWIIKENNEEPYLVRGGTSIMYWLVGPFRDGIFPFSGGLDSLDQRHLEISLDEDVENGLFTFRLSHDLTKGDQYVYMKGVLDLNRLGRWYTLENRHNGHPVQVIKAEYDDNASIIPNRIESISYEIVDNNSINEIDVETEDIYKHHYIITIEDVQKMNFEPNHFFPPKQE